MAEVEGRAVLRLPVGPGSEIMGLEDGLQQTRPTFANATKKLLAYELYYIVIKRAIDITFTASGDYYEIFRSRQ